MARCTNYLRGNGGLHADAIAHSPGSDAAPLGVLREMQQDDHSNRHGLAVAVQCLEPVLPPHSTLRSAERRQKR
jgi:hypothetical protein